MDLPRSTEVTPRDFDHSSSWQPCRSRPCPLRPKPWTATSLATTYSCDGICPFGPRGVVLYFGYEAEGGCDPNHSITIERRINGGAWTTISTNASSPFTARPSSTTNVEYRLTLSCPGCGASDQITIGPITCP